MFVSAAGTALHGWQQHCMDGSNIGGPAGAKHVADMLRVTGSMTRLDVSKNRLGDEGEAVLRKAIEGRSGFELLLSDPPHPSDSS